MLLSPNETIKQLDEMNKPYNCQRCGQPGKNPEERRFVYDTGVCYVCDGEILHNDDIYDELKEQL